MLYGSASANAMLTPFILFPVSSLIFQKIFVRKFGLKGTGPIT